MIHRAVALYIYCQGLRESIQTIANKIIRIDSYILASSTKYTCNVIAFSNKLIT